MSNNRNQQVNAGAAGDNDQVRTNTASSNERTVRNAAPEVRGDRASQDAQRTQENGLISDEEFSRLLNEEFDQTALPKPPAMPGWHLCWLTTTSAYDTIQKRMRLGYQPCALRRCRGSIRPTVSPSVDDGNVKCNEMVLFKIREERYQQMMVHYHHKQPLHEEAGIVAFAKDRSRRARRTSGKPVDLGAGITEMEESVRRGQRTVPTFAST
jgi:hypothetical protein